MTLPPFAASPGVVLGIVGAVLLLSVLAATLWLVLGRAPRRQRAYKRGQRFLHEGDWEEALAAAREIHRLGRMSRAWEGRLRNLQGEAHHVAGDQALKAKHYEDALQHFVVAADFLNLTEAEFRTRVVEAMLTETLRQFAAGLSNNEATQALLVRLLKIQPGSPAGTFWQGLCHLRDGRLDLAQEAFAAAHETGGRAFIDPPLYLGMVLLRQGKPQEALRALAEANRVDAACPFVPLHMGLALVAANGDAGLAVRALQRSLSQRGLQQCPVIAGAFRQHRLFVVVHALDLEWSGSDDTVVASGVRGLDQRRWRHKAKLRSRSGRKEGHHSDRGGRPLHAADRLLRAERSVPSRHFDC